MAVAGAVLCGGASRRMGADKALIEVDRIPLAERVALALADAGCDPVVLVGGDEDGLAVLHRRYVADRWPGDGPVGGVLTALIALSEAGIETPVDGVVVAACDLVALTSATVGLVIDAAGVAEARSVTMADSGRLEPMLAYWPIELADEIGALFPAVRSVHELAAALGVLRVEVPARDLRNANHPRDLGLSR